MVVKYIPPTDQSIYQLVLEGIEFELEDGEFYNGLDNSDWKSWTDQEKFQWAYRLWYSTAVGKDMESWLRGLPLGMPYMNDEIEKLGHNPDTYWLDCATEIVNQVGDHYITLKAFQYPELWREPLGKNYVRKLDIEGALKELMA